MAAKSLPCPTLLRQLLRYEPETGKLFWNERGRWSFPDDRQLYRCRCWNTRYAGGPAMSYIGANGYRSGKLFGVGVLAHRVIWAITYGEWPARQIDHIDGDRLNNRLSNLRCVTHGENLRNTKIHKNNTSGFNGVSWVEKRGKWTAQITHGHTIFLGAFDSLQAAIGARSAAEKACGFHPNHGKR